MRQCEASGEWNGSRTQCNILHCPNITTVVPNSRSCDTFYTSTCMVECEDGYKRLGNSSQYSCGLNGTEVVWKFTDNGVTCCPGRTVWLQPHIAYVSFCNCSHVVKVYLLIKQVLQLSSLIIWHLPLTMDGHGLSNKVHCACPAKGDKREAVLAVHFITKYF